MKNEISTCTDIPMLIDFIGKCQQVCHDQKKLAHEADKLHNEALDGIKMAKKRLKELSQ